MEKGDNLIKGELPGAVFPEKILGLMQNSIPELSHVRKRKLFILYASPRKLLDEVCRGRGSINPSELRLHSSLRQRSRCSS